MTKCPCIFSDSIDRDWQHWALIEPHGYERKTDDASETGIDYNYYRLALLHFQNQFPDHEPHFSVFLSARLLSCSRW